MSTIESFTTIQPANKEIQKYISYYYFHSSEDPTFKKSFTFYPNYKHGLTVYLGSNVDFRNCSNESRAKIGRANKSLHWFEILKSKQLGFELYDFGGLSLDGKTDNIDRFKKSFGGYLVNEWRSYSFFL